MAKKKKENIEVIEEPQVEAIEVIVEEPKKSRKEPSKKIINDWEIKDRMYVLKNNLSPLTYTIKSSGMYFFDEDKGYEREISYATNQSTPFVDEFKGQVRFKHIVFENGSLFVPKERVGLQKFLSLYHPKRDKLYYEVNKVADAEEHADVLEWQLDAMNVANELDIDIIEAILRAEIGSKVSKMTSRELKRDALLMARERPSLFLELAADENIHLRNVGVKAVERNIIKLSNDQRTFSLANTGRKLMTVPFDEHPYNALAAWFKTDEGMQTFASIEKRLN